jgi:D-3-phosphoglycerate dehydrogenase
MVRPLVFVGNDYAVPDLIEDLVDELGGRNIRVVRGKAAAPPAITEYAPAEWPQLFGEAEVIFISTRTRAPRGLLESAPRLRGVVFPTIGTDSIDLSDARDLGLMVGHGPTPENFTAMAESTVMLIAAMFLDLRGKMRSAQLNLSRPSMKSMKARIVQGKTIGFVGMGRISRAVVERLAGWGTEILAYDPYVGPKDAPAPVRMVDMDTLLARSDLVSVHVTLTKETHGIIGALEIAKMKPGAYLINTSRGGAVVESALYAALQFGHIGGAALDVFEVEPLSPDSPFRRLDNVILTSHIVGHVREMHDSFLHTAVENVVRLLRGEPPLYVRNPEVLPRWRARIERMAAADAQVS